MTLSKAASKHGVGGVIDLANAGRVMASVKILRLRSRLFTEKGASFRMYVLSGRCCCHCVGKNRKGTWRVAKPERFGMSGTRASMSVQRVRSACSIVMRGY